MNFQDILQHSGMNLLSNYCFYQQRLAEEKTNIPVDLTYESGSIFCSATEQRQITSTEIVEVFVCLMPTEYTGI